MPTVIAILGPSFCGSSLLNMMLDSHPAIFGGGEIQKHFLEGRTAVCSICLKDCPFWDDPKLKSSISRSEIYKKTLEKSNSSVLVDSSKTPSHFTAMRDENPEADFLPIILTKHPMRLVSSYLGNQYIPKTVGLENYRDSGFDAVGYDKVVSGIEKYLETTAKIYENAKNASLKISLTTVFIAYEDVVERTQSTLTPVLHQLGLNWTDRILAYSDQEHHPIGGNSAAHYNVRMQTNPKGQKGREKRMTPEKLAYYSDRDAQLRLDDKFKKTLRGHLIKRTSALPGYAALCQELGYDTKI